MTDDQPSALLVVPTELGREDGFLDLAVLFASGLAAWWLVLHGVPWPWVIPPLVLVALWTLTGAPAADFPYLGAIASGLHSALGLRRAHEWLFAFGHYFNLAVRPVWEAKCVACWRSCRRRIMAWRVRLSEATRCRASAAYSWACRIPSSSSVKPDP